MLAYGSAATKNVRFRKTMEDAHKSMLDFVNPGDAYFGVFDGHAGSMAADWCAQRLHTVLEQNIKRYGVQWQGAAILAGTFDQVDKLLLQQSGFDNSGTTAAVAHIKNNPVKKTRTLFTANVGDARIVLCTKGIAERLSQDHRTDNVEECGRVKTYGGQILNGRVCGVLAVTRALGDHEFKQFVCGKPYTTETLLDAQDEFVIIACDGVWDVISDQEAVELVRHVADPKDAAKQLVRHAIKRGSTDNITCLVVRLAKPPYAMATAVTKSGGQTIRPTATKSTQPHPISKRRTTFQDLYKFVPPRVLTPPPEELLAELDESFETGSNCPEDPELERLCGGGGISYGSSNNNNQQGRLRYGSRRISVPCIFDKDENSDAIQD